MFNFIKRIRNKDNTPKKGYNLSYDNLAIPEIHIKDSKDETSDNIENSSQDIENSSQEQDKKGVDTKKADVLKDTQSHKLKEHKKTHVTYDGVAVPEIHFKNEE